MSGGFRYYEGGHRSQMDEWMDGCVELLFIATCTRTITAYSQTRLHHSTFQSISICYVKYWEIVCHCYLIMMCVG